MTFPITSIPPLSGPQGPAADMFSMFNYTEVSITEAASLDASAFGKMHVCTGTSVDYTIDLPAASGNAGRIIGFRMSSALTKLVTLDASGGELIDGITTRIMWASEVAILMCDGVGWIKVGGKSIPMQCTLDLGATSILAVNTYRRTPFNAVRTAISNQPLLADTANSQFIIIRPGIHTASASVLWGTGNPNNRQCDMTLMMGSKDINIITFILASNYGSNSVSGTHLLAAGDTVWTQNQYRDGNYAGAGYILNSTSWAYLSISEIPSW